MRSTRIKIAARTLLVMGVFALAVSAAAMRDANPGITFATNGINLKIDSRAFYNGLPVPSSTWAMKDLKPTVDKFFNLVDLKPGDSGKDIISIHPLNAPAWSCIDFYNLKNDENGVNEPESHEDATAAGELSDTIQVFGWRDDGNNKFDVGEKPLFNNGPESLTSALDLQSYTIRDFKDPLLCQPNWGCYVGIAWCHGTMTVDFATAVITCDGTMTGNATQTDTTSVDVAIRAVNAEPNPKFICGGYVPEANTALIKLFFDNFDLYPVGVDFDPLVIHRWVETGGVQAVWGLEGKVADLDAGLPTNAESLVTKSINMSDYHSITLSYMRKSDDTNAPPNVAGVQSLNVEYSVDGGGSWTVLEAVAGETLWTAKSFSLSPLADGKPDVKVRFTLTGADGTNHAYLDAIKILGIKN